MKRRKLRIAWSDIYAMVEELRELVVDMQAEVESHLDEWRATDDAITIKD